MVYNRVKKQMKKMRYFVVLAILAMGLTTFTTSCEALLNTCFCTWEGWNGVEVDTTEELDEFEDVESCSELASLLEYVDDLDDDTFRTIDCV